MLFNVQFLTKLCNFFHLIRKSQLTKFIFRLIYIKIAAQNATGSELWQKNSRRIWIKYHPIYFSVRCLPRLNIAVFCQNKTKNIVTTKFDGRPLAPTLARGMVQKSKLYYLHGRIMVHNGAKIFLNSLFKPLSKEICISNRLLKSFQYFKIEQYLVNKQLEQYLDIFLNATS